MTNINQLIKNQEHYNKTNNIYNEKYFELIKNVFGDLNNVFAVNSSIICVAKKRIYVETQSITTIPIIINNRFEQNFIDSLKIEFYNKGNIFMFTPFMEWKIGLHGDFVLSTRIKKIKEEIRWNI